MWAGSCPVSIVVLLLAITSANALFLEYGCGPGDNTLSGSDYCGDDNGAAVAEPNVPISGNLYDVFLICIEGFVTASLHGQSIDFGPMYEEYSIVYQGAVYYRETQESGTLSTISDVVASRRQPGFVAQWALVVTWVEVPDTFCGPCDLPCDSNTFQLVLVTDFTTTYALYNYESIELSNGWIFVSPLQENQGYEQVPPSRQAGATLLMGKNGTIFESNADVPNTWIYNASSDNFRDVCMTTSPCGPLPNRCVNEVGNLVWSCVCGQGFEKEDGNFNYDKCSDIDECSVDSPCQASATCVNSYGSYECQCNDGYTPHSSIDNLCEDLDECSSDPCPTDSDCVNTEGSFTCVCQEGLTGVPSSCSDLNECDAYICNTEPYTDCQNTDGSYNCVCRAGYSPIINGTGCEDTQECLTDPCAGQLNYKCVETQGSYICVCTDGFIPEDGDTGRCIADYECVDQTVGFTLDSAGKEYVMLNTDVSPVPSHIKLAIVSDACRIVEINITRPGTEARDQYQIVPFFSHTSDFVLISSTTALPLGDSVNRSSLIKSDEDASIHAYFETASMISAFLVFPVDVLDKVYILNIPLSNQGSRHETDVLISALGQRTQVTVRLTYGVSQQTLRREKRAIGSGGSISITLQPYQTHRFGVDELDLSGTQLQASDKIAVFVTVNDPDSGQTRSHQVPAQKTLGKSFMMTEFHGIMRIVSTQANTEVIYNGLTHYISGAGDVLIVEGYVGLIETNKPVSAMAVTPQASGLVDEELIFPLKSVIVDQYTFSTLEYSVTGDVDLTLVVVTNSAFKGDVRLNGLPLIDYDPYLEWVIPRPHESMFCYAKVHGLVPGVYTITHPAPEVGFTATLYAHDRITNETVYSYPIGASMRDLTCTPTTPTVNDHRDNDCDGRVDEEVCLDGEDFDYDGVGDEDCASILISHQPDIQPQPELLSETCCHGGPCLLSCPEQQIIRIVQSHYGRYNYIGEKTCHVEVDEFLACGLIDANDVFEETCDDLRTCNVEITTQNFRLSTNCTLRSLYAVVAYMCLEPDQIECTVPAVRNVKAFHGQEDEQFIASNPPENPAYAGYEVLSHHGNIDNGAHTDYSYLHSLGEPAIACKPEYADTRYGLEEWCADETKAFGAYIQVFIGGPYRVTNVVLQGSRTEDYWVTKFSLEYSSDEKGQIFKTVKDTLGDKKIFEGNYDARHAVLVALNEFSFTARYVRLTIEGYHRYPALHVDFLRCATVDGCAHLNIENTDMIMQSAARLESYIATCFEGYMTPAETKSFTITCDRNGNWQGAEQCQEIECGPFRTPSSMAGLPPQALPFLEDFRYLGSSGSQTCLSDSELIGVTQIKCHTYANITSIPVCQIRDRDQCQFPFVENAIVNVVTANVGSRAVYECSPGFDLLTPTSSLSCLPGGELDGTTPICDVLE